ncbi:hypothetical protein K439DRAFT_438738 [Ramaria rubella]|nr:hypothetical protein K439DRAFT_438738 [Ramaria rubella]
MQALITGPNPASKSPLWLSLPLPPCSLPLSLQSPSPLHALLTPLKLSGQIQTFHMCSMSAEQRQVGRSTLTTYDTQEEKQYAIPMLLAGRDQTTGTTCQISADMNIILSIFDDPTPL